MGFVLSADKIIVFENAEVTIELFSAPEIFFLIQRHTGHQSSNKKNSQESKPIKIILRDKQRKNLGVKNDLLAKALGWKIKTPLKVIDATAGLGRDLEHMLSLGCDVIGIEQNVHLYKALRLAFPEAKFIHANSENVLQKTTSHFAEGSIDVIYLDPMFPVKKKTAAVGKESLLLQYLTDSLAESADIQLFHAAVATLVKRVVVKRPLKAEPFADTHRKLSHSYEGKAVRYDVYI